MCSSLSKVNTGGLRSVCQRYYFIVNLDEEFSNAERTRVCRKVADAVTLHCIMYPQTAVSISGSCIMCFPPLWWRGCLFVNPAVPPPPPGSHRHSFTHISSTEGQKCQLDTNYCWGVELFLFCESWIRSIITVCLPRCDQSLFVIWGVVLSSGALGKKLSPGIFFLCVHGWGWGWGGGPGCSLVRPVPACCSHAHPDDTKRARNRS